jgi:hypothetical protein
MTLALRCLAALLLLMVGVVSEQRYTLSNQYRASMPTKPESATGKVIPLNVHDTIVYITDGDADYLATMRTLQSLGFPALVIVVAVLQHRQKKDKQ